MNIATMIYLSVFLMNHDVTSLTINNCNFNFYLWNKLNKNMNNFYNISIHKTKIPLKNVSIKNCDLSSENNDDLLICIKDLLHVSQLTTLEILNSKLDEKKFIPEVLESIFNIKINTKFNYKLNTNEMKFERDDQYIINNLSHMIEKITAPEKKYNSDDPHENINIETEIEIDTILQTGSYYVELKEENTIPILYPEQKALEKIELENNPKKEGFILFENITFDCNTIKEFFNDEETIEALSINKQIKFLHCQFIEKEETFIFFSYLNLFKIKGIKFENMDIECMMYIKNTFFTEHHYEIISFENCTGFNLYNFKVLEAFIPCLTHLKQLDLIQCNIQIEWLNNFFKYLIQINKILPLKKLDLSENLLFNETMKENELSLLFKFIRNTPNLTNVNLSDTGIPKDNIEAQFQIIQDIHPIHIQIEKPLSQSKDYPDAKLNLKDENNNKNPESEADSSIKSGIGFFKNSLEDIKNKIKNKSIFNK